MVVSVRVIVLFLGSNFKELLSKLTEIMSVYIYASQVGYSMFIDIELIIVVGLQAGFRAAMRCS